MFRRVVQSQPTVSRAVPRRSFASGTRPAGLRDTVLVDACRTPFAVSGTHYNDLMAWDLGRMALKGLLTRTALDPKSIDRVIMGTVIQESRTSNVARESALGAGIPNTVPASTVTLACISSNVAVTDATNLISTGQADIVVASGTETMSDVPIRFSRPIRKRLIAATKAKKPMDFLKLLKGLKLKDLAPEAPAIAEFSTGEVMGHSADRLAAAWGVTREEQDAFALRSHHNAAKAAAAGLLTDVLSVSVPPKFDVIDKDNGVRGEATLEKLASLKPAFVKPHGTVTAATSSFLTDGASAALLMSAEKAKELGYTPTARIVDSLFVSQDPKEELLLGPAYATARILEKNGLTADDIDVWEIHEAFAGQVLANIKAMASEDFCKNKAGTKLVVGQLPMDKVNNWGGSASIGHPFAATGVRLLATTTNRLHHEGGKLGLISACAAGGQANAMLVEKI